MTAATFGSTLGPVRPRRMLGLALVCSGGALLVAQWLGLIA